MWKFSKVPKSMFHIASFFNICWMINESETYHLNTYRTVTGMNFLRLWVTFATIILSNTALHADDSCSDDETDVYYTDSESTSSSTDAVESASPAADAQPQQLKSHLRCLSQCWTRRSRTCTVWPCHILSPWDASNITLKLSNGWTNSLTSLLHICSAACFRHP